MNLQTTVNHSDFINELTSEVDDMRREGTSYRRETAELSLKIAREVNQMTLFSSRKLAEKTVNNKLPFEDNYRVKDVAKMLHVVLSELHFKANLTDELKTRLLERSKNRKPLKLVPVR